MATPVPPYKILIPFSPELCRFAVVLKSIYHDLNHQSYIVRVSLMYRCVDRKTTNKSQRRLHVRQQFYLTQIFPSPCFLLNCLAPACVCTWHKSLEVTIASINPVANPCSRAVFGGNGSQMIWPLYLAGLVNYITRNIG